MLPVMGTPICVENLLLAKHKMYVLLVLVLSVPTTSVVSKCAIPVLTTVVTSLHIHFRCYYRSRKGCISSWCSWREEGRHVEEKSNTHVVMDNHASCAEVLRDASLVTLDFVTRVASAM